MVGLKKAREASEGINREAQKMEINGACVDLEQGEYLLEIAIETSLAISVRLID